MQNMDWSDFYKNTVAYFKPTAHLPQRPPDFVSPAGSMYYYFPSGVVRNSAHWSNTDNKCIGSCFWKLTGDVPPTMLHSNIVAYCDWADFRTIQTLNQYDNISHLIGRRLNFRMFGRIFEDTLTYHNGIYGIVSAPNHKTGVEIVKNISL